MNIATEFGYDMKKIYALKKIIGVGTIIGENWSGRSCPGLMEVIQDMWELSGWELYGWELS